MLKKLSIVTGVLVILGIALWFAQGNIPFSSESETPTTILASLDTAQLSSVLIQEDAEKKVELIKVSEGDWKVRGINYEADTQKLQELFLQLLDTKLGDRVTEQAKHHARFQLMHVKENNDQWDEEKTGKLLVLHGKEDTPVLEILLGKSREEQQGQYIRYANQAAVYLIAEDISLSVDDKDWLNLFITDVDGDAMVRTVEIQNEEDVFRFVREKKEDEWQAQGLQDSEALNPTTVKSLGNALKYLTFEKLVPAETAVTETGRENLAYYTAELFDGRIVNISIGTTNVAEEENYYLAIDMALRDDVTDASLKEQVEAFNQRSNPWLYGLQAWVGERFLKNREDVIVKQEESE